MRRGPYKLVQVPYLDRLELYDLEQDPSEQNDLLEQPTADSLAVAREMLAELQAWTASARPLSSEFVASQQDEVRRRLEALGYLGGP